MSTAMAANSDLDAKMDALQSEVARLREEARLLEVAQASTKEDKRRAMFVASDLNGSGGLDKEELQACMRIHFSIEMDEQSMVHIFEMFDDNKSGELELHEFNGEAVMHALDQRKRTEALARQQQQQQQEQGEKASPSDSKLWKDVLAGGNQDDGILVRLGSALAYVLPICDGIQYAWPLALILPQLLPILQTFGGIESFADTIPFGVLIWFLIMDYLSKQPWVPPLLRFNLGQAVRLDVRMSLVTLFIRFVPSIVGSFVPLSQESINQGMIQEDPTFASLVLTLVAILMGVLAFLLLATAVLYSVVYSIAGSVPERVPFLSKEIAGFLGLHHRSSNLEAN